MDAFLFAAFHQLLPDALTMVVCPHEQALQATRLAPQDADDLALVLGGEEPFSR